MPSEREIRLTAALHQISEIVRSALAEEDANPVTDATARERYEAWRADRLSQPLWEHLHDNERENWRVAVRVDRMTGFFGGGGS